MCVGPVWTRRAKKKKTNQKVIYLYCSQTQNVNSKIILRFRLRNYFINTVIKKVLSILQVGLPSHYFLISFNFKIFQNTALRIIWLSHHSGHNFFHF